MDSIASDNGLVEREPGFGAVPRDELVYCVPVSSPGLLRRQTIENRRSCLIQVRQTQIVLGGRLLTSIAFAALHCRGLHAPASERTRSSTENATRSCQMANAARIRALT